MTISCSETNQPRPLILDTIFVNRKFRKHRVPFDLSAATTDEQLFRLLREFYGCERRGWRVITTLRRLRLTKYILIDDCNVDVLYDSSDLEAMVPPLDDCDYEYSWLPSGDCPVPILGSQTLWSKYSHTSPTTTKDESSDVECLRRLPKRKGHLQFVPGEGFPVGWGLEFVEDINWRFLVISKALLFATVIVFSIIWAVCIPGDGHLQTVFGIGQWAFGATQVLFFVILGVCECLLTANH